jgi:hypothetical protein
MQTPKRWTVTVEADPDDAETLILPFPDDLLAEAGWKEGDTLIWTVKDDLVSITKK